VKALIVSFAIDNAMHRLLALHIQLYLLTTIRQLSVVSQLCEHVP